MAGKFAVVTGASSGIGLELARVFGQNGYDLLINSNSGKLQQAAFDLKQLGFSVIPVESDLTTHEGVEQLWREVEATGRDLDAIAINAGVGVYGDFARESSLDDELKMIALNVTSTVHLAKRALRRMTDARKGKMLLTSSIAGVIPSPLNAVYGATKSFILSFGQALQNELQNSGVTVTVLQPGATNTNFFHRAGMDHTKVGSEGKHDNDPAEVALQGYEALMAGKDHVFAESMKTKIQGEVGKFMPSSMTAEQHRKQAEPKEEKKSA